MCSTRSLKQNFVLIKTILLGLPKAKLFKLLAMAVVIGCKLAKQPIDMQIIRNMWARMALWQKHENSQLQTRKRPPAPKVPRHDNSVANQICLFSLNHKRLQI